MVHRGTAIMVMEFVEGETFAQMIRRRGPIPEVEAIPLFRQALLGIGYAHRAGILHRDIKPSNLMLNKGGLVKVMDFGIAKVIGARGMTRTGTQLGTLAYMSPEQIQNRNVDIRSDVYELGITLYEMLTGHLPFESDSEFQIMQDHVYTPPPPPSKYYPYITPWSKRHPEIHRKKFRCPVSNRRAIRRRARASRGARLHAVRRSSRRATMSIGGGSTLSHPHLSVSAVPPAAPSAATPAPSSGASGPAASLATPVPLPTAVPTVPSNPAIGATPRSSAHHSRSSRPTSAPLPTQLPIAAPKSKKPLIIAAAALALLLVVGVAAYQVLNPTPHSGSGSSPVPPPAQSVSPEASAPSEATHAIDELPPTTTTAPPAAAPKPKPERASRQPAQHPKPTEPAPDQGQQMYQKAQAALSQQHYFEPVNDSALHWAILARQAGNPAGKALEEQIISVYKTRVTQYYKLRKLPSGSSSRERNAEVLPRQPRAPERTAEFQAALSSSNSKR